MKELFSSPYWWCYLLLINAAAFSAMAIDKRRAQKGRRRISESTLLGLAILGGSPACLLAMYGFHHKTRKPKFYGGVPLILLLQLTASIWLYPFLG